jgi:hypothetical protein
MIYMNLLNGVKAELAEERRLRAEAQATAASSFEKAGQLDTASKAAFHGQGQAEAAVEAINGQRRSLEAGLHTLTSQLNLSAFYGIGGARGGRVARVKGVLGDV